MCIHCISWDSQWITFLCGSFRQGQHASNLQKVPYRWVAVLASNIGQAGSSNWCPPGVETVAWGSIPLHDLEFKDKDDMFEVCWMSVDIFSLQQDPLNLQNLDPNENTLQLKLQLKNGEMMHFSGLFRDHHSMKLRRGPRKIGPALLLWVRYILYIVSICVNDN